ncbi:hypothetical protein CUMW_131460 [Citrus unshiu]|uniref:Uncharacterized protein n=1 Tax=Citrus unshiu TaxID=55188 RepID=A0A2H5PFD7_CITUN|nr:hypothetical protein CUMW_131460 [Citrus unshiu]
MHVLIFPTKPFVEWGLQGESQICSPAVTLTFDQESMCDMAVTRFLPSCAAPPARTVGWGDPGFIIQVF